MDNDAPGHYFLEFCKLLDSHPHSIRKRKAIERCEAKIEKQRAEIQRIVDEQAAFRNKLIVKFYKQRRIELGLKKPTKE